MLLETVSSPERLRAVPESDLPALAAEIRSALIGTVTRTGGHLGPNLGVVELTIALHRVFESPRDPIIWDTGHQAYVHKMLTGRASLDGLRQAGGLSGYPSRAESPHDLVENSHASTSLSYLDGMARALALTGQDERTAVAVIGDGALTGGMCWEALNNIAAAPQRPVVVVLNDNGRSYAPTVGAVGNHLAALAGGSCRSVFEQLGMAYVGPVDGHDVPAVEAALRKARDLRMPTVVHCLTRKGYGYPAAEDDEFEKMHTISPAGGAGGAHLDRGVRRRDGGDRRGPARRGGADRRDAGAHRPARVRRPLAVAVGRRRDRRTARGHLRRRAGDRWPAPGRVRLRDVPQPGLRPGADGRGAARPAGDLRARPGRGHRQRRPVAPRHVGPDVAGHRARHAGRRPARRRRPAGGAARGGGASTGRRRSVSRSPTSARRWPPSTASARPTSCAAARRC